MLRLIEGLDLASNQNQEINRIITGKGSVIKHMKDGSMEILYANGNTALTKRAGGKWIITNN